MQGASYRAFYDLQKDLFCCSVKSDKYPLVINCAGITVMNKPFTTNNPTGRKDYYLLYLVKGSLNVSFPDGVKTCTEGTIIIFPPELPYTYALTSNDEMVYYYVHFSGSQAEEVLAEYGFSKHPDFIEDIPIDHGIKEKFSIFFDTFAKTDKLRDRELYLNFERILMAISRKITRSTSGSSNMLERSIAYINSNLDVDIRIKTLADMENMSVSAYNAHFVKAIGMPPGEYVITTRLANASALLVDTDISIREIGEICGYPDPQFFSKIFKSHIGESPRNYRNKKRRTQLSDDQL